MKNLQKNKQNQKGNEKLEKMITVTWQAYYQLKMKKCTTSVVSNIT